MKLTEFEGKELLRAQGIKTPAYERIDTPTQVCGLAYPFVLKSQVLAGDRKKKGGVVVVSSPQEYADAVGKLFTLPIDGMLPKYLLAESFVAAQDEAYVSYSYSDEVRGPVLALSPRGGSGTDKAHIVALDMTKDFTKEELDAALLKSGFSAAQVSLVSEPILALGRVFAQEYALLAEINPLFITKDGQAVAGDAKVILDDEKVHPNEKHFIEMDGDIAILASGGGASMLNVDALLRAGGKPANYTEYSGNPSAEVVRDLTIRTLSKKNLRACWVVGAAANFTDIYTTLSGLLDGLRALDPKPTYPIVIRRDGPRREEAFTMLKEVGITEGFDFHLYDSHTPMVDTAKIVVELAYKKK